MSSFVLIGEEFPCLTAIVALLLLACVLITMLTVKETRQIGWYALEVVMTDLSLTGYVFVQHHNFHNSGFQLVEK
ncbi:hypothetical protein [Crocosphaera sp. Alani8]|uniref:hypothetical protein n=1 Tax=Crocosphaera sp. Alani8 TaxID=3038952 RepID=UPI00313D126B